MAVPAGGIEARPLGVLSGQWAFALLTPLPEPGLAVEVSELWAIPLDGGQARLAARLVTRTREIVLNRCCFNSLHRQFSPDGRSVVLSVATPRAAGGSRYSLVILELETGQARIIGSDDRDSDLEPAWSPDGRRIAYVRRPDAPSVVGSFDDGIWIMNADATGARRVLPGAQGSHTQVWGWAPDSATLGWTYAFEDAQFNTVHVDNGTRGSVGTHVADAPPHSWRPASPQFAGAFQDAPRMAQRYIVVTDHVGAPEREVAREQGADTPLSNVRWHPTRNELMYLRGVREIYVLELGLPAVRIPIATAGRVGRAEWSPGGNEVLYTSSTGPDVHVPATLRYMGRNGANDRVIFSPQARAIGDLAVRRY